MSPLRMWLNSCAITPCSSSRLSRSSAPRVTATTASDGRVAGGEGVDAGLVLQHVHLRHRHAGGDGHLLDHVAQPPQRQVGGVRRHRRAAELQRHRARRRRAGWRCGSSEPSPIDQQRDARWRTASSCQRSARPATPPGRPRPRCRPPPARTGRPAATMRARTAWCSKKFMRRAARSAAAPALRGAKKSCGRDQNCTFGASRTCACSSAGISSSAAGCEAEHAGDDAASGTPRAGCCRPSPRRCRPGARTRPCSRCEVSSSVSCIMFWLALRSG